MTRQAIIDIAVVFVIVIVSYSLGKENGQREVMNTTEQLLVQAERAVVYLQQTDSLILSNTPPTQTVVYCTDQ